MPALSFLLRGTEEARHGETGSWGLEGLGDKSRNQRTASHTSLSDKGQYEEITGRGHTAVVGTHGHERPAMERGGAASVQNEREGGGALVTGGGRRTLEPWAKSVLMSFLNGWGKIQKTPLCDI